MFLVTTELHYNYCEMQGMNGTTVDVIVCCKSTMRCRYVMRMEISIGGLLVDPITNSQNSYHKNCMAVSRENY